MRSIILFFTLLFVGVSNAQFEDRVEWTTAIEELSEGEYQLTFTAIIDAGWHIYGQPIEGEEDPFGPIPTEFAYNNSEGNYELIGATSQPDKEPYYDKVFDQEVIYFEDIAIFTQKIKLVNPDFKSILVDVSFGVCNDRQCLPPDTVDISINLDGTSFEKEEKSVDATSLIKADQLKIDIQNPELLQTEGKSAERQNNLWAIFGLGFLGGLIALLTPCVFPMIPLTVSFFTKQSGNRSKGIANALLYGLFIVVIYFLLSLPFHLMDNLDSEILNNISTNVWLNVFFFAIFIFFAFSFFGYYELTLPASWGSKMDSASNVGGVIGIFFMAVTLAIVSFSCTGPILGGLLGSTTLANGNVATNLSAGMTGFGAALALPFALFAMFPAWLNSLPKSGGWLNTVKVHLGFAELALAFKFLSISDLVQHWGILKREVFIGIWVLIGILWLLYTLGKLKFPHDGPIKKLGFSRIGFATLLIAVIVYIAPGLMKNPMWDATAFSGMFPPDFYSVYKRDNNCPLGIDCYKDFDEGLAVAKSQNKPIMIDFTGWGCVNCRRMEENVWVENDIYSMLKDDYILISLYVDDKKDLEDSQQFDYELPTGRIKEIKTVGNKWATFQTINFQTASQPYYILIDTNFNLLNSPQQYTDKATYKSWLKEGLARFEISTAKPKFAF
ncbi:cytochrome c biogenesis protein CcdA [Spongiivirga sp. MCCC 1A20706]|uniref:protein-disulfide reductase DsbD family protein n=1 Tax=Spongiivirga sp. MCCC 1A20706 TaxID=3160963 RepID=UPI0039775E44